MDEYSEIRYSENELREFLKEVRRDDAVVTAERVDVGDTVTGTYGASALVHITATVDDDSTTSDRYEAVLPSAYEWRRHTPEEGRTQDGMFRHAVIMPLAVSE